MKQILVTGGAGYIGSHTILKLLEHINPLTTKNLVEWLETEERLTIEK